MSDARALRATITRLQKIDRLLIEIGGIWGDVDQYLVNIADDLRGRVEDAMADVRERVDDRAMEALAAKEERTAAKQSGSVA